jgi:hypothetical protein
MIKITKTSIISGTTRTIELLITQDQLERWQRGEDLIQNIMPDLTPEQREFVMKWMLIIFTLLLQLAKMMPVLQSHTLRKHWFSYRK